VNRFAINQLTSPKQNSCGPLEKAGDLERTEDHSISGFKV
jgi:hypothetical protein